MLGFENIMSFERSFMRHEIFISDGIITVTKNMIDEAMLIKIKSTADIEFKDKFDQSVIDE